MTRSQVCDQRRKSANATGRTGRSWPRTYGSTGHPQNSLASTAEQAAVRVKGRTTQVSETNDSDPSRSRPADVGEPQHSRGVVFISHEKSDAGKAGEIRRHLEAGGLSCWMAPDDIHGIAPWPEQVEQAIDDCDVMLVVVSANASASKHVSREVDLAVEKGKPLLPVRVEDVAPTGTLNYFLRLAQWIDLFPGSIADHAAALETMLASILAERGLTPAVPTPALASAARRRLPKWAIAVIVAAVIATGGILVAMTMRSGRPSATITPSVAEDRASGGDATGTTLLQLPDSSAEAGPGDSNLEDSNELTPGGGVAETETAVGTIITTYYWSEDQGWVEHTSLETMSVPLSGFPILIRASNSSPYPAFMVRVDDLTAHDVAEGFEDGGIPATWHIRGNPGTQAEESDGQLVFWVPEGPSPSGFFGSITLMPAIQLGTEFDVSVRFSLDADYYSLSKGELRLSIDYPPTGLDGDKGMSISDGWYMTSEWAEDSGEFLIHEMTEARDIVGGLRITGTPATSSP